MTSASGLFQHWRTREGRASASPDPPAPSRDPDLRRRGRIRRRPGGPPDYRHRAAHTEHESVQSDHGDAQFRTDNSSLAVLGGTSVNRMGLNRHDQLPSAVQQARARLLERLAAFSLTRSRHTTMTSSTASDEFSVGDDFEFIDYRDLEIDNSSERFESGITFPNIAMEANHALSMENANKKPPGLSWDAISALRQGIFKAEEKDEEVLRASMECCICLELFLDGEGLIQLQCCHRFHRACLEPWLLTCGDCPYCRARI